MTAFVWDAGGDGTSWSDAANWDIGSGFPDGNDDTATFNATSSAVVTGAARTIGQLTITTGFSGSVTVTGGNLTLDDAGANDGSFTLDAGTLDLGGFEMLVDGGFTKTGGTFTGGAANSKLSFFGSNAASIALDAAITVRDMLIQKENGIVLTGDATDNIIVTGEFEHFNGTFNSQTVECRGTVDFTTLEASDGQTYIMLFDQAGNQTISGPDVGPVQVGGITVNKSSGTVDITGAGILHFESKVDIQGGTLQASATGTFRFSGDFELGAGGTWDANGGTTSSLATSNHQIIGTPTFAAFTMEDQNTVDLTVNTSITVTGLLTLTNGGIETGTINAQGDVTQGGAYDGGSATLEFNGSGTQTITGGGGSAGTHVLTLNSTGTLSFSGSWNQTNTNVTATQGAISGTGILLFNNGTATISGNGNLPGLDVTAGTGQSFTFSGSPTIEGDFITQVSTAGNLNFTAAQTITFRGDVTISTSQVLTTNGAAVVFDGGITQTLTLAGETLSNVTISTASTVLVLADAFDTDGDVVINASAVFDLSGQSFTGVGGTTTTNNGTLRLEGDETLTNLNLTNNSGSTVEYTATAGSRAILNLTYDTVLISGAGTFTSPAAVVCNADFNMTDGAYDTTGSNFALNCVNFTITTAGAFTANASVITCSGNFESSVNNGFIEGTSTVTLTGTGNLRSDTPSSGDAGLYDVNVAAAGQATTLTADVRIGNIMAIGSGTLGGAAFDVTLLSSIVTPLTVAGGATISIVAFLYGASATMIAGVDHQTEVVIRVNPAVTFELQGNFACTRLTIGDNTGTGTTTLDTTASNFSLTCTTDLRIGRLSASSTRSGHLICNGSTVNVTGSVVFGASDPTNNQITGNTATLNVGGNWDNTNNGIMTMGSSAVVFNGSGTQTVTSGGGQFNNVTSTNTSAGGVVFTDAVDIGGTLTANAASADIPINFDETASHTVNSFAGLTGSGSNHVVLRSEVDSNQWDVSSSVPTSVDHVDVQDSNLSGVTVQASVSNANIDSGNNSASWVFTESVPTNIKDDRQFHNALAQGFILGNPLGV